MTVFDDPKFHRYVRAIACGERPPDAQPQPELFLLAAARSADA